MGTTTFLILIAAAFTIGGWALVQIVYSVMNSDKRRLQERLVASKGEVAEESYRSIVKSAEELRKAQDRLKKGFVRKLARAHPDLSIRGFLMMVSLIALGGFVAGAFASESLVVGALSAMMAGAVPFLVVNSRSARVQRVIDDQLPDALDFLARILRAGHSLSTAFQMSGEELPDPMASEFRRCYDQHSLGQPLEDVMKDMAVRVDVPDVAFFVTAVLIQRQTGGDLAEVLRNIAGMIRARIRLQQHVKAITAEGRLVGAILLALPFIFFFILYVLNPNYAGVLLNTTEGRWVTVGALVMQVLGVITIKKIVSVRM
jgi:tight adherence protein B